MLLLNSIWLFALGALSIPIAIHLWNISRGKTLKVGSIALINYSLSKRSRSFKLHDILLLILRCLLLALTAFVLAAPFIRKQEDTAAKGWVMIPREEISASYQQFKPEIDSLKKAGYSFHYFNKGFQKADLAKALSDTGITRHAGSSTSSYWGLVQQLDQQLASTLPIYLFTPNSSKNFTGDKPQVALNLKWRTFTAADSVTTWIQNAAFTNTSDINVVQGIAKSSGTWFARYLIRSGDQKSSPFNISVSNGRPAINIKNTAKGTIQTPAIIDTATLRYAVFTDKYTQDANYVTAALQAIAYFSQHKIIIKQYNNSLLIPPHQNWVFWLSDKPVDKNTISNSSNILSYEKGKMIIEDSWINSEVQTQQNIPLYKLVSADEKNTQLIWHDGFGKPVLCLEQQPRTNSYHFYSRFDPAWNDLVWSNDFPKLLLKLISDKAQPIPYDNRVIDKKQLQPVISNEKHVALGKLTTNIDLSHYFWLLLILVLITERWLAHKNKALQNG